MKSLDEFGNNKSLVDGKQRQCKLCQKLSDAKHYQDNKDYKHAKNREIRSRNKEFIKSLKLKCEQCGEEHPACLDFHHVDPNEKEYTVSYMVLGGLAIESIEKEIAKCKVWCSHCHRKYHWQERQ